MSTPTVYRQRPSVLDKPTQLTLGAGAIEIAPEGGAAWSLPYAEIAEIRLLFDPTRIQPDLFKCIVTARNGTRLIIQNKSYRGLADFTADNQGYRDFVSALHERLHGAQLPVRFHAGNRLSGYIGNAVILLFSAMALIWAIGLAGGIPVSGIIIVKLVVLAAMIPLGVRFMRRNRPRAYSAADIPGPLLPAEYSP